MNITKNNLKAFNLLKKNERNVNVFKYKNNFYLKHKELIKACENQKNKEGIILKSYLFKKEKAYLNEKDIGKILNKVIKKKIKNEYIWDSIQNLLFKFHLRNIEENNCNEINGHNQNVIPTNNKPSLFYYNQKFDHINVYLLSIAIKTLNKRNACMFNFLFSYLQHFYSSIEPRHFIHIFHVLVKNTYRNLINESKENNGNVKYNNCTHLRKENGRNNYMTAIREIYRDNIICSEKNLIELLTKYCIVNINYFSYNDIGLICESLCYFSIKDNPFSEYWNDFLFYIFDLNIKGKGGNGEIHIIESSKQCEKLCTSNIFLKNYEHSELFLGKKKLASNFYMDDKYVELNGKNVLSILKYVYNYHSIFPDIIYIGAKLKHILLKNNLDITLHEYSEILYYLNCLNELDLTFLKEKTNLYQYELESELLSAYDIECLLKISQIYFSYFVSIPFLNIFLNNVHKISTESSLILLKLILKYYECNVYYHKISAQRVELKNALSYNVTHDNISSYGYQKAKTYFMDHTPLNNTHFDYSFRETIQNKYNDVVNNNYKIKFIEDDLYDETNSFRNNSNESQNCTQNLIDSNAYSNKKKTYFHNKLTNKLLKGGRKKRKICKNHDQDNFYSDNNLTRSLFLSLYSTCSEMINTLSYKEIFFLCDILNKENFVHYGVIKGISNKVSEDLSKWKLGNSHESQSHIDKYYADYLVFVASFIYDHNSEGENIIDFLLAIFLNNNNDKKNSVQSELHYYYAFYLINLKIANNKTASIEHLNLLIRNAALFNYSDLYNNILIYFLKSCKNNYKYIIKNRKLNFNEKKKIQKKNSQPSSKDVVINNMYYSNAYIFSIKSFNIEILKIFLYLWNINQPRPGRRCLDFIVMLNKFYDDISVRTYICSYNIINMLSRYVHLLHIKKEGIKKKTTSNYIFYLNDQIKGAILRFNLENVFSLFNKEKKDRNICLEKKVFLQDDDSDKVEKIKNSENYILNDYKHKKNIVTKKEIKNAKPAKYFKNCKKGQPVDHFLSMYVNEYSTPQ
ncbi:conserved Plasmodium protein, unknown function [Plasmodium vinckei]|uniref:Uncharacterized protein n=1 Tax=Plasmodium vinckei TaxID=5860 RepID=A0A6V7SPH2_PLAVN|nr:conserved Plasmodium protein, unknown function [Plasmodium vinckei]